jgi:hypothetical protein
VRRSCWNRRAARWGERWAREPRGTTPSCDRWPRDCAPPTDPAARRTTGAPPRVGLPRDETSGTGLNHTKTVSSASRLSHNAVIHSTAVGKGPGQRDHRLSTAGLAGIARKHSTTADLRVLCVALDGLWHFVRAERDSTTQHASHSRRPCEYGHGPPRSDPGIAGTSPAQPRPEPESLVPARRSPLVCTDRLV